MNKKCYNCINYLPLENDCNVHQYNGHSLKGGKCSKFHPRKKCNNRYEFCEENCLIICNKTPHKRGCPFVFKCKHDSHECDEKCSEHVKRKQIHELKCRLSQLESSRNLINTLIKECQDELGFS